MTCLETYATLRIFSASQHPDEIGRVLGIRATLSRPLQAESRYRHERESHYWAWSTKGLKKSTDGLEHLGAIIEVLQGKEAQLEALRSLACEIDISCFWVSSGQGGPFLDRPSLYALARLGLDIWWDVYFGEPSDYSEVKPQGSATTMEQSKS